MASTNKTTNYELSQFVETDRPAWLTDYNGDMRTIDSTMKAISDVASGASGSISELADRMSTAEGNITTNTNDIAALDARADALEAQAQSTAGTIANIQTEQTAQNMGIEAATALGYNLARPYDSASTYAVGAYVLFQNTLYKCITAVSTGEAFDPTKWLAIKATDEIAAGGYTLPIASASQLGGVKVGDGLSIDPATGILNPIPSAVLSPTNQFTFDTPRVIGNMITITNGSASILNKSMIVSDNFILVEVTFAVYGATKSTPSSGGVTIRSIFTSNNFDINIPNETRIPTLGIMSLNSEKPLRVSTLDIGKTGDNLYCDLGLVAESDTFTDLSRTVKGAFLIPITPQA